MHVERGIFVIKFPEKFGGKGTNYHNDVVLPSKRALYLKSQEPKCYINMRIKKGIPITYLF